MQGVAEVQNSTSGSKGRPGSSRLVMRDDDMGVSRVEPSCLEQNILGKMRFSKETRT